MTSVNSVANPLRVIQVGTGGMGRTWLETISRSHEVELVGLVDLSLDAAQSAAAKLGSPDMPVGSSITDLVQRVDADAVINVTVPVAHHPVVTEALFLGLPVLGEKPVALNVAEALSLAAASEVTGALFMVSQSRRYDGNLLELKALTKSIGQVGIVATEFFRAPRFGGFRDAMDFPLLLDMAIHPFDSARLLLDAEPVSVFCDSFNPSWSWYRGDAAVSAIFEMTDGTRFAYNGSWCSPGLETSWNGRWRLSASGGSAYWDGDNPPRAEGHGGLTIDRPTRSSALEGIDGSLAAFVDAIRNGGTPDGEVHGNVMSLAMVEAAVESATNKRRVLIGDVLERALEQAIGAELHSDVRQRLSTWPTGAAGLASGRSPDLK